MTPAQLPYSQPRRYTSSVRLLESLSKASVPRSMGLIGDGRTEEGHVTLLVYDKRRSPLWMRRRHKEFFEMYRNPGIQGFTTNPTLMRKAGVKDYEAFAAGYLGLYP